ncbi:type I-E CRISPR-associated protein Cas6/Cse3/CasE [Gilliamella sp. CG35]|uniref:type I-E CRISPR-associated protein Cas6/Cse3/CasE n=1 Tax=Gilliamella sp. CG35 TaxID=3351507 RepID=UPI003985743B
MYFSKVELKLERLPYAMQQKWFSAGEYAMHQWLWQLFPDENKRPFLFHKDQKTKKPLFYLLSEVAPLTNHELFKINTKPYAPQLTTGMKLSFLLRANPVVMKQGKRCDVMMNAKYQAKQQGLSSNEIKAQQYQAAIDWLIKQSEKRGFSLQQNNHSAVCCNVISYNQHLLNKKSELKPISYSSVDFEGVLTVTDPKLFLATLYQGIGKSKGFGCGLFLIKHCQ